ncbi:MAG: hypothetical protein HC923_02845 [Myxococcales bacterium]|nr:hypothetical protein [Myxococcales bacterium]
MDELTGVTSTDDPRWRAYLEEVERVLAGRPLSSLVERTSEGLGIAPLYLRADLPALGPPRPIPAPPPGWTVMSVIQNGDPAAANRRLLEDLEKGAEGALIVLTPRARGSDGTFPGGVELRRVSDVERLLKGVHLEAVRLSFEAGVASVALAEALRHVVGASELESRQLSGCLGFDWRGTWARLGALPAPIKDLDALSVNMIRDFGAGLRVARIDASVFAEAGRPGSTDRRRLG